MLKTCSSLTRVVASSCLALAFGLAFHNASASPFNEAPPVGAIIDLSGNQTGTSALVINHGTASLQSGTFVATTASTNITFAFRDDPAYISFSGVTLLDLTTMSNLNLITNGDFASGTGSDATNWTYLNQYGATAGGNVSDSCGGGLTTCWYDGAVSAYDAITQAVLLDVGHTYSLSFLYSENGNQDTFSSLENGSDAGINILAYAQDGAPLPASVTPEPGSLILTATGLLGTAGSFLRRRLA